MNIDLTPLQAQIAVDELRQSVARRKAAQPDFAATCQTIADKIEAAKHNDLTDEERYLIKDLIQFVSKRPEIERAFQVNSSRRNTDLYNCLVDSIYNKLAQE